MNIREELTCKYCYDIYNSPIILTCCGDNICKHHIEELISNNSLNKFLCPLCNNENTNQNFNVNKLIVNLINKELHKYKLNSKHEAVLNNLKMEIKNLEKILINPENYIYEEINELKRQVDLDKEKLKKEIDKLAHDLIQQLESYEKQFKAECKKNVGIEQYNGLIEASKKQLDEHEKCLSLFSKENEQLEKISKQSENTIQDLQPKLKEIQDKLFSNLSITYKPTNSKSIEGIFGKLVAIDVSFYIFFWV
jgi:DNA repair exonuclease SbcCD ATPase subunit